MTTTYRVVLQGPMPGQTIDRVAQEISGLFKLTLDQAKELLSKPGLTIKRGIDLQSAAKYQAALEQRGCVCVVEPEVSQPQQEASTIDPQPALSTRAQGISAARPIAGAHKAPAEGQTASFADSAVRVSDTTGTSWVKGASIFLGAASVVVGLVVYSMMARQPEARSTPLMATAGTAPSSQFDDLVIRTFNTPSRLNQREAAGFTEAGGAFCEEFKDPAVKTATHGMMSTPVWPLKTIKKLPAVVAQVEFVCESKMFAFRKRVTTWVVVAYDREFDTPRCQFVGDEKSAKSWAAEQCGFEPAAPATPVQQTGSASPGTSQAGEGTSQGGQAISRDAVRATVVGKTPDQVLATGGRTDNTQEMGSMTV